MRNNKNIFDGSCQNYLMRNNGFYAGFNMPEAVHGEKSIGLPPYAKRMPYLVDEYPACPKDWLRSEGIVKSYFVPVLEDYGMWLDFNENSNHTHHVAIVISVQGINPITGMPCHDAQLEQYIEECPKHKIKFGPDRYCSKCDYKWPKQNYVCTTGTPNGYLWLDGFRSVEGIVRQYILTTEKMRGVASNIIGKDRVYAVGLSFFISKEKKPKVADQSVLRGVPFCVPFYSPVHTPINWQTPSKPLQWINTCTTTSGQMTFCSSVDSDSTLQSMSFEQTKGLAKLAGRQIGTKKLEIGAGSKIDQTVYDDPEKLEFWHDKPESIICINYVNEQEALKIIEQGEIDIDGHEEGFLKEIPVGN